MKIETQIECKTFFYNKKKTRNPGNEIALRKAGEAKPVSRFLLQ